MCDGEGRFADLDQILSDPGSTGPRALRLAEIIRSARKASCRGHARGGWVRLEEAGEAAPGKRCFARFDDGSR